MTTTSDDREAYVWVWLPGASEPVVCGRLRYIDGRCTFTYGTSYLGRQDAVPLYLPELPLERGRQDPGPHRTMPGCIADAGPDSWGQRIIEYRQFGVAAEQEGELSPLTYLLRSDSDRIGALDFQASPDTYVARTRGGTLEELERAAAIFDAGGTMSPALDDALLHGSSVGGARPKAVLDAHGRKLIAKFSSRTDSFAVVRAEAVAMDLARRVGLHVASTELREVLGRDVLLVDRFDREGGGVRRMMVSALTILGLDEHEGRSATYHDLADQVVERFTDPGKTLRELFARIVFNIAVGNTDDHARNHAAFWDGAAGQLTLTPAYDVCPYPRAGQESSQAMAIGRDGSRSSRFATCVRASKVYGLTPSDAQDIVDHQVETIRRAWADAADLARLTAVDRSRLWERAILNPSTFYEDP